MSEPGSQALAAGRRLISFGGDVVAGISVVGAIVQTLPSIAAALGIIWYLIQINESHTWRNARRRLRMWCDRRHARRRYRAEIKHHRQ